MDGFSIAEDEVEEPDSYENEQIENAQEGDSFEKELDEMDNTMKENDLRKQKNDSLLESSLLQ